MASPADDKDRWAKWYWGHWRADAALRSCSIGARGLWMEMLTIMAEAQPKGYLLINGQRPSDEKLARACAVSPAELRKYSAELLEAGVPSIDDDGVWRSRRMVRDEHKRQVNRANGSGGGNPTLTGKTPRRKSAADNREGYASDNRSVGNSDNRPGYPNGITDPDNHPDKSRATRAKRGEERQDIQDQNPSSAPQLITTSAPAPAGAAAGQVEWFDVLQEACRLAGINPAAAANMHAVGVDWARAGWSPDLDIYPAIRDVAARPGYQPPRSVAYFGRMIADRHALRTSPTPAPGQTGGTAPAAQPPATVIDWERASADAARMRH